MTKQDNNNNKTQKGGWTRKTKKRKSYIKTK